MAAEVVVVVEDQNPPGVDGLREKEMRRGKPADSRAHHNEIVGFAGVDAGLLFRSVAKRVRRLERSGVAAAHAGEQRRIVARPVLSRATRSGAGRATRSRSRARIHGEGAA